ncbi:MAG: class I SAM-dependent methyltransferase [Candidatus Microthrix sp.]|nr:class I SAM-dependent methyltransferase [Candidatus Microthrix sp.]
MSILNATAEDLPLEDASVDAVTVGQAFHWFDPQPALAEIARVLRPGGVLLMVWNARDEDVDWMNRWGDLVAELEAAGRTPTTASVCGRTWWPSRAASSRSSTARCPTNSRGRPS